MMRINDIKKVYIDSGEHIYYYEQLVSRWEGVMQLMSNLSLLMGKFKFNIQDVHERTGLARRTISTLYNDKATRIDFSTIEKLCLLFGCGIEQLFTMCEDKGKQSHYPIKENTQ